MLILNYSIPHNALIGNGYAKNVYELDNDMVLKVSRRMLGSKQKEYLLSYKDTITEIPVSGLDFKAIFGGHGCEPLAQTVGEWVIWECAKRRGLTDYLCPVLSYGITNDNYAFTIMPKLYRCPANLHRYDMISFGNHRKRPHSTMSTDELKYARWAKNIKRLSHTLGLTDTLSNDGNYMVDKSLSHCYLVDYGYVE